MKQFDQLGKNIRLCREAAGMTQSELAERLFVSFQAVSAWERGQSVPDLENAVRIAELFGISVDTLLKDHDREIFVGIDGGGTKTEFVSFLKDGTVIGRVVAEGTNPNDVGEKACLATLNEGLSRLLQGANPKGIFAGIAGASAGEWKKLLSAALSEKIGSTAWVDTDAANVLSLAPDPKKSAMIICGTGSCVFVRRGEEMIRLGGWGQLLDESGSAYDVGKDALRHALAVEDGLEEKSLLSKRLSEELGDPIFASIPMIYEKGRAYIASLAPLVCECAENGDEKSLAILEKNAQRLAKLLTVARTRYGAEEFICAGGFFKNLRFREMVAEKSKGSLIDPALPPVCGACIELLCRMKEKIPEDFRTNFENSYRRVSC